LNVGGILPNSARFRIISATKCTEKTKRAEIPQASVTTGAPSRETSTQS